jgi:PilZ domain
MFPRLTSKQDRRQRRRQLLNTSVRVITKLASMDALGINISQGGMGLFTIANLPLGSRIEVEFRTPEGPASFTRVAATVRHRALYLYGIEFNPESGATRLGADDSAESDSSSSVLRS